MFAWLKSVLQGSSQPVKAASLQWTEYKEYRIAAVPRPESGQYRVAGIIETTAEPIQRHEFVRADLIPALAEAEQITLMKAKSMIDQLGSRLFAEST